MLAFLSRNSNAWPKLLTLDVRPDDPWMSAGHPARKRPLWAAVLFLKEVHTAPNRGYSGIFKEGRTPYKDELFGGEGLGEVEPCRGATPHTQTDPPPRPQKKKDPETTPKRRAGQWGTFDSFWDATYISRTFQNETTTLFSSCCFLTLSLLFVLFLPFGGRWIDLCSFCTCWGC